MHTRYKPEKTSKNAGEECSDRQKSGPMNVRKSANDETDHRRWNAADQSQNTAETEAKYNRV